MLCLCLPLSAQKETGANPPPKEETPQETNQKIKELAALANVKPVETPIGVGDLLHIDVFDVPELSRDVRVSDTGDIGYPLIPGKIKAAGFSHFQLEEEMQQLLVENGLVSHPQVTVFVREQTSQPISIVGAVMHPMVYQAVRPTTLLEILAIAGGIADTAGSEIKITRMRRQDEPALETTSASMSETDVSGDKDQEIITIRVQDLLESGNAVYNIPVYGGDVITVPAAGMVYVMGAGIAQPGGYVLASHGEQITVLKAVALAHGLNGFSKADDSVIMRNNPATGQRDTIPVRIKKIEDRKADDVIMKPNDILYIPNSEGKKALARGAEAAIGIGTGVAIYRTGG
jgi:polysaccharide biosynthesis/export protein